MKKLTLSETLELNKQQRRAEINERIKLQRKQRQQEILLTTFIGAFIIIATVMVLFNYVDSNNDAMTKCQANGKTYNQCLKSLVN